MLRLPKPGTGAWAWSPRFKLACLLCLQTVWGPKAPWPEGLPHTRRGRPTVPVDPIPTPPLLNHDRNNRNNRQDLISLSLFLPSSPSLPLPPSPSLSLPVYRSLSLSLFFSLSLLCFALGLGGWAGPIPRSVERPHPVILIGWAWLYKKRSQWRGGCPISTASNHTASRDKKVKYHTGTGRVTLALSRHWGWCPVC